MHKDGLLIHATIDNVIILSVYIYERGDVEKKRTDCAAG